MELACQGAKRAFDRVCIGISFNAENLEIILVSAAGHGL